MATIFAFSVITTLNTVLRLCVFVCVRKCVICVYVCVMLILSSVSVCD